MVCVIKEWSRSKYRTNPIDGFIFNSTANLDTFIVINFNLNNIVVYLNDISHTNDILISSKHVNTVNLQDFLVNVYVGIDFERNKDFVINNINNVQKRKLLSSNITRWSITLGFIECNYQLLF